MVNKAGDLCELGCRMYFCRIKDNSIVLSSIVVLERGECFVLIEPFMNRMSVESPNVGFNFYVKTMAESAYRTKHIHSGLDSECFNTQVDRLVALIGRAGYISGFKAISKDGTLFWISDFDVTVLKQYAENPSAFDHR